MKRLSVLCALFVFASVAAVSAQPRPVEKAQQAEVTIKDAPATVETKYEGGVFGYSEKEKGTLNFDDVNQRLVFKGKDGKEKFSFNYEALIVVALSSTKVQSGAGRTVGAIPLPGAGLGGSFIKKTKNYLVIQFRDPDTDVQGTTSFLIDTGELLLSVVKTLGEKAEMRKRGDAYFRPSRPAPGEPQ